MITVSVVIVTYNRSSICQETVSQFLPLLGDEVELVVVDQGPGEQLQDYCRNEASHSPQLRHIRLTKPGTTRARNAGIQSARGSIILFVDDDVIPYPDLIHAHLDAYRDPTVGAVAGRIIEGDDDRIHPVDPRALDPRYGWLFTRFCYDRPVDLMTARGCNMSVRRQILVSIGGFDTQFSPPMFFREESDVSLRVIRAGYRLRYIPTATLIHLSHSTGGTRSVTPTRGTIKAELAMYRRLFLHLRDDLYFQAKHFRLSEQAYTVAKTYRDYVGLSRWPWRLLAKNLCFVFAFCQAQLRAARSRPPYFDDALVSRSEVGTQ